MFEPIGSAGKTFKMTTLDAKYVDPDFPVLCDICEPTEPKYIAKWTFIFSSPDHKRYKEIMKAPCTSQFTMPTWSELELRFLAPNNDGWLDAFCTFGGVPRHVFPGPGALNPHNLLNESLTMKGFELATSILVHGRRAPDEEQNFMLIHMNPPKNSEGIYDYSGSPLYSFASNEIFSRLAEFNTQRMIRMAVNLFDEGSAFPPFLDADKTFKMVCLWLPPINGQ
jgi:hypothetical protein